MSRIIYGKRRIPTPFYAAISLLPLYRKGERRAVPNLFLEPPKPAERAAAGPFAEEASKAFDAFVPAVTIGGSDVR